jgi:hypothetical protein
VDNGDEASELRLDGRFIHKHDGQVVLYGINPMTLSAFQALGVLAVLNSGFARWTNQNLEQILGDHDACGLYAKRH